MRRSWFFFVSVHVCLCAFSFVFDRETGRGEREREMEMEMEITIQIHGEFKINGNNKFQNKNGVFEKQSNKIYCLTLFTRIIKTQRNEQTDF